MLECRALRSLDAPHAVCAQALTLAMNETSFVEHMVQLRGSQLHSRNPGSSLRRINFFRVRGKWRSHDFNDGIQVADIL
jgi:hypothetical protein